MKKIILSVIFALVILSAYTQPSASSSGKKTTSPVFRLTKADYTDRVYAIWASQIISFLISIPFENYESAVKWVDSLPRKIPYAPVDDDWYYEMITIKAFEKYGSKMTIEQMGEQWVKDSAGIWGSSKAARSAMLRGIKPGASGHPLHNRFYYTIGPQFSSDVYGALSPGMPNLAGKLARYYGHINGYAEGTDAAVFVAGAISAAFNDKNIQSVVEKAASLIHPSSPYRKCLDMVIELKKKGRPAKDIFEAIESTWRAEYPAPNNAVANGGIVATCLLFGEGDFLKTLNLACVAADYSDADCNAASATAVVAAMHGTKAIPARLIEGLHDRIKGDRMMGDNLVPALDETISSLSERTVNVATGILKDNSVQLVNNVYTIPVQKVITQPAELFTNSDMVELWNKGWKIERARKSVLIEDGALITTPVLPARGLYLYKTIPASDKDSLIITAASENNQGWELVVMADNDKLIRKELMSSEATGRWQRIAINISKYKGREYLLRIFQRSGTAYWKTIEFK